MVESIQIKRNRIYQFDGFTLLREASIRQKGILLTDQFVTRFTSLFNNYKPMKIKNLMAFLALFCLLASYSLNAQSESTEEITFYQEWNRLPEDGENHTEVDYAVIDCNGTASIIFVVFNENGDAKDIELEFTLTDGESQSIYRMPKRHYSGGETVIGKCGTDSQAKIAVPQGMDPSTLNVSVTYL